MQQFDATLISSLINLPDVTPSLVAGWVGGAVTGGLASALVNRRHTRRLERRLQKAVDKALWVDFSAMGDKKPVEVTISPEKAEKVKEAEKTDRVDTAGEADDSKNAPVISRGAAESEASDDSNEVPIISRGVAHADPAVRLDGAARAALIDSRIARIEDEPSIEPGVELASVPIAEPVAEPAVELAVESAVEPADRQSIADYVSQMVQEEMELNRSGSARRYSRSHLTMIEGTGDLSDARRVLRKAPRHLSSLSKEA